MEGDQDVGGLDVPVDHPFLVRMLHRLANLDEQLEPASRGQLVLCAKVSDFDALDPLHDEIGPAGCRHPGVVV